MPHVTMYSRRSSRRCRRSAAGERAPSPCEAPRQSRCRHDGPHSSERKFSRAITHRRHDARIDNAEQRRHRVKTRQCRHEDIGPRATLAPAAPRPECARSERSPRCRNATPWGRPMPASPSNAVDRTAQSGDTAGNRRSTVRLNRAGVSWHSQKKFCQTAR